MNISELAQEFDFVDSVTVERNREGQIDLKMPQRRYDGSDEKSIHQYGWGPFCKFDVDTSNYREEAGVYVFTANHQIMYVGKTENVHRQIRSGYSNISPRNCFEGGQQTNCRINNEILEVIRNGGEVELWVTKTPDKKRRKAELIEMCNPRWNFESPSNMTANQQQIACTDDTVSNQRSTQSESTTSQQESSDGKYAPLYNYLKNSDTNTIHLSFREIENILGAELPMSARKYEAWWNPSGHSHAEGWEELGWTANPNLDSRTATFEKTR